MSPTHGSLPSDDGVGVVGDRVEYTSRKPERSRHADSGSDRDRAHARLGRRDEEVLTAGARVHAEPPFTHRETLHPEQASRLPQEERVEPLAPKRIDRLCVTV